MKTTAANVRSIMDTGLEDSEINKIIEMADRLIDTNLAEAGLTDAVLADISTYLTAHLIAIGKERQVIGEKVQDIWLTFPGPEKKEGLRSTTFGQMVIFLDSSGTMLEASKLKARMRAIPQDGSKYD
jgi:hypothetical protein